MATTRRMSLNQYVTIGHSGLRVSPLCLGTMTFGKEWGWGSEPEDAKRILDAYVDRGGNFIDTANGYTKGHSEVIIGEHLAHDRKKRDRVVIATKFLTNMFMGDPNGGGSNRKAVIAQCEESLRRLADRLHRPLLASRLGQDHPDRGDDARARHTRRAREGSLPRIQRYPGLEGGAGADDGAPPRVVPRSSHCRSSIRCSSGRWRGSSCRWRRSSASGSRRGARSGEGRSAASTSAPTRGSTRRDGARGSRIFLDDRTFDLLDLME